MSYLLHLCFITSIYAILSVSLDILVGHLGLLVLCQSAFFAVGSYGFAIALLKVGAPFPAAALCGIVASAGTAATIAIVARRLRGDAVILASFALLLLLGDLLKNLRAITGGLDGLAGIPSPQLGPFQITTIWAQSLAALGLALLCWWLTHAFTRGPYGRFLHALRDDTYAAVGLRVKPLGVYVRTFTIAGAMAGLAGVLYASYASYINPNVFGPDTSILIIAMVLVGGAATRFGPIAGAVLLLTVPEVVRFAGGETAIVGSVNYIAMGTALVAFATLRPRGLLGGYEFQ